MESEDYREFKIFFTPLLEEYHKINLKKTKISNSWDFSKVSGIPKSNKLDISSINQSDLTMSVRTSRNINK